MLDFSWECAKIGYTQVVFLYPFPVGESEKVHSDSIYSLLGTAILIGVYTMHSSSFLYTQTRAPQPAAAVDGGKISAEECLRTMKGLTLLDLKKNFQWFLESRDMDAMRRHWAHLNEPIEAYIRWLPSHERHGRRFRVKL